MDLIIIDLRFVQVVDHLREVIAVCEEEQDFETREILEELLNDTEEDHTYWLEQQLGRGVPALLPKAGMFPSGDHESA